MISLNGDWSFAADRRPEVQKYGNDAEDPIMQYQSELYVTLSALGEYYAVKLCAGNLGETIKHGTVAVDIPASVLTEGESRFRLGANADYTGMEQSSLYLLGAELMLYGIRDGDVRSVKGIFPASKLPAPLGYDLTRADERTAELVFETSDIDIEKLRGARVVLDISAGGNTAPQKRRLLVSVNGSQWFGEVLDSYADGGTHDIAVKIPAELVASGEISVVVTSNIDSSGNMTASSLDMLHTLTPASAGEAYIGNSLSDWGGSLHADRNLCVWLRLKDRDENVKTVSYESAGGTASCVIGKYMGGADFYHRQDFNVNGDQNLSEAEVIVRAHVGREICAATECRGITKWVNHWLYAKPVSLHAGSDCAAYLELPEKIADGGYAKLRVSVMKSPDAAPNARVFVSVNGGPRRAAYITGQSGRRGGGYAGLAADGEHFTELELPVRNCEFVAGRNLLVFSSDMDEPGKILLCCASGDGKEWDGEIMVPERFAGVSVAGSPVPLRNVLLSLTVYSLPSEPEWTDAPVPAVWESYERDETGRGKYVSYDGVGWFRRKITLGEPGAGYHSALCFDAVDYYCEVWLCGIYLGAHEGGYDSFALDIETLFPDVPHGTEIELTVRVTDQSFDIKDKFYIKNTPAGFLQDSIGMNYAGIWQNVWLARFSDVYICDVYAVPDAGNMTAEIRARLRSVAAEDSTVTLSASVFGSGIVSAEVSASGTVTVPKFGFAELTLSADIRGCIVWSPDMSLLYRADVEASAGGKELTGASAKFGVRSLCTEGTSVLFNGQKIMLTGILDWMFNFDGFSPAVSPEEFTAQLRQLKSAGFNAVKFCLVVPPEYILDIMDEQGMYAYVEYPMWYARECSEMFCRAYRQLPLLVCQNRSHPSLIMSDFNCELPSYSPEMDRLMKWIVAEAKRLAPNRLYLDNSSNGVQRYGDFTAFHPYHQLNRFAKIADIYANSRGRNKPVVFGEYADTDTVRDTRRIRTQNGGSLPWWWETLGVIDPEKVLGSQGVSADEIAALTECSFRYALESKKYYMEETKKCPDIAGLFITHKNDIGPTMAGLFDELGNFKYPERELARSAAETVLLLDCVSFNVRSGCVMAATPLLAHYNGHAISNGHAEWELRDADDKAAAGGILEVGEASHTQTGGIYRLGGLCFTAPAVDSPAVFRLCVRFLCGEFTAENLWNVFVYPDTFYQGCGVSFYDPEDKLGLRRYYPQLESLDGGAPCGTPKGIVANAIVATEITPAIEEYLKGGGTLVYAGCGSEFVPVSRVYNWSAYAMPFIPDTGHPALGGVGRRGYGCLDFLELMTEYAIAGGLAGEEVIIRRLEHRAYRLSSYLTQIKIGCGTLIQSTLRFGETKLDILRGGQVWMDTGENVIGRYLLDCLIRFAAGETGK